MIDFWKTLTGSENEDADVDKRSEGQWKSLVTNVNDTVATHNPLIGREKEAGAHNTGALPEG